MTVEPPPQESGRAETSLERADRNLSELIVELRVALPGVQVLFAFLLVLPFNDRFTTLSGFERHLYLATLLCAAGASVFLIAPTAQHRMLFRRQDKEHLVVRANRYAVAGLTFLAVAMTCSIVLVTDVVFKTGTTVAVGLAVAVAFVVLWYVIPLRRRAAIPLR